MRTVPGAQTRSGIDKPVQVQCPYCKGISCTLPPGTRIVRSQDQGEVRVVLCEKCGAELHLRTVCDA